MKLGASDKRITRVRASLEDISFECSQLQTTELLLVTEDETRLKIVLRESS